MTLQILSFSTRATNKNIGGVLLKIAPQIIGISSVKSFRGQNTIAVYQRNVLRVKNQ